MVSLLVGCGENVPSMGDPTASVGVSVMPTDSSTGSTPTAGSNTSATMEPTRSPSATQTPIATGGGVLYQLTDPSQMMSYVIQTQNNKVIVLDGGYDHNKADIIKLAKEITGQAVPEIEAWFFSHAHDDHVNAFSSLVNSGKGELKINKLYYSLLTRDYVVQNEPSSLSTYDSFVKALNTFPDSSKVSVQQGDVFEIDGLEMQVMLIPDETAKLTVSTAALNESSVIYRLTIGGQRVMFLGDAYEVAGTRLRKAWINDLTADVVQMAHHGSQGVQFALYKLIAPKACLWPTPDWLWENRWPPSEPYDSGSFETIKLHTYMQEICGVKHHYVAKDGIQKLVFPLDLS